MRLFVTLWILIFATVALAQAPPTAAKPLGKNQIMDLVKAGMDSEELAKTVQERGIDFEPTDDYLQGLRQAGAQDGLIKALGGLKPKPLTREQVLQLVVGGVPSQRAADLVQQRGIGFMPDEEYLGTLRVAGAEEGLLAALRTAGEVATAEITVITAPNAEVYLDGELKGRVNAQGELAMKAKLGVHALKVALAGKKAFQQRLTLAGGQAAKIEARLEDLPGSIRVRTLAGASVLLDNSARGSADAGGELVLAEVSPGAHEVRVSAQGKKDHRQIVTVRTGQESRMEARLADAPPAPGTVRENPKDGLKYVWIPSGTFQMGCSPGDSECEPSEKPSRQVTISKGFWLGQTEVTVEAFSRFANQTGAKMPQPPDFNQGWSNRAMPIVSVSWDDAQSYCQWAGGRLPTDAEWEYAARGGSTEARYGPLDDIAWYADNSGQQRLDSVRLWREGWRAWRKRIKENGNGTREVGQKRANGFGLFDMLGNAWEWVGPADGEGCIARGGSWAVFPRGVRVSMRDWISLDVLKYSAGIAGFRCGVEGVNP